VEASAADRLVPIVLRAARAAATSRDAELVLHITSSTVEYVTGTADVIGDGSLATEWEWENSPELTLAVVDSVDHAVELFNRYSPRFAASLISDDPARHQQFYDSIDAPFVGNGFTRWVDGQFAFLQPELGLSNWQAGRLFGRGGVLSGDSVYSVRLRASISDSELHR
jgi:glutamate-5-semialdehyde dehydrogenase